MAFCSRKFKLAFFEFNFHFKIHSCFDLSVSTGKHKQHLFLKKYTVIFLHASNLA